MDRVFILHPLNQSDVEVWNSSNRRENITPPKTRSLRLNNYKLFG